MLASKSSAVACRRSVSAMLREVFTAASTTASTAPENRAFAARESLEAIVAHDVFPARDRQRGSRHLPTKHLPLDGDDEHQHRNDLRCRRIKLGARTIG